MALTRSLGICLGASNIKAIEIIDDDGSLRVGRKLIRNHESNPRTVFIDLLKDVEAEKYDYIALTGRKFRDIIALPSITEPEAVEYALHYLYETGESDSRYGAIASLGAENFVVYVLDKDGNIATVETGNKCASGTGEFFLQQIRRMDIGTDEAIRLAKNSEIYKVSGRCSVFCKSDCTHALNKGVPIGRVTAGLSLMMAEKVMDLLEKIREKRVIAIGSVTHNHVVMDFLRPRLDVLHIPVHADVFEALGAALYARANKIKAAIHPESIFKHGSTSFTFLPPISQGEKLVEFKQVARGTAQSGDECILGLDVGSTTTKAVLLRSADNAILASIYLRTNGNPVKASRECYAEISRQVTAPVSIVGLATTGSGRHIAGLHAQTDAIINEIIAHATGAAFFDKEVDTIFEIGGQDAKYTYLTNAVPSDYAMNEACSAGTGSFLEESAQESLGIGYREIEKIAAQGQRPPNFNDQCAAFISSDIKTATHEGIAKEDIVAGLVYSICMNYVNRVKGQRKTGKKIFMQGGVCYNRAVPVAMANLIGRPIVVPPEPGLIGAFGVAMELKNRIETGLAKRGAFDMQELAGREIEYGKSFICAGGKEKCDRGCEINMLVLNGRKFPFGGACNKYYNLVHHIACETDNLDYVRIRQEMLYHTYADQTERNGKTVGISRSYLTNSLYPLFQNFFSQLGCTVVLSDQVDPEGIKRKRTAFCYPGEIAHGCFANLLKKNPDFIFLPRIIELFVENSVSYKKEHQSTCMLMQSEEYWLKSAFKDERHTSRIISPIINFGQGYETQESVFADIAVSLGSSREQGTAAFRSALEKQKAFSAEMKRLGNELLHEMEKTPEKRAVVIFGRTYNGFAAEANMGIPTKFASRGVMTIPWDFLSIDNETCDADMCWANGQMLLRAASFVKKHPQLFGAFITNFSCGPDSFLVGYFRDIMKAKPSLTLELDSHTADAGVNTRIEAFLDIVDRYRQLAKKDEERPPFRAADIIFTKKGAVFVTSRGEKVSIYDQRVHVLFPSMGKLGSELVAAALSGAGIRSSCVPVYTFDVLKLGRANASCKECLPLQLTVGGFLHYLETRTDPNELLVYFMPTTTGNCRFTQYSVFLRSLIDKNQIRDVALLSLTTENGYAGMPIGDVLNVLKSFIVSDVMEDIKNALSALAVDQAAALREFERQWARICAVYRDHRGKGVYRVLEEVAGDLRKILLKRPLAEAKKVSLFGEIFVRRDYFSCHDLINLLQRREIVVKRAHIFEWLKYIDYMVSSRIYDPDFDAKGQIEFWAKLFLQNGYEKKVKSILARSGLYELELIDMKQIMAYGEEFFDKTFTGESILVVGNFFKDILHTAHGVISVGPFACMPTRVIEAILSAESSIETKKAIEKKVKGNGHDRIPAGVTSLPFLSIEADGNPFPQIVEARIEAFCMQVERLYARSKSDVGNRKSALPTAISE
jgi:predicted CoA-substrate-specific enzyme activase